MRDGRLRVRCPRRASPHPVRYAGVLASASKLRPRILPEPPEREDDACPVRAASAADSREPSPRQGCRYRPWAELLKRTFAVDVLCCPRCAGRLRFGRAHDRSPPSEIARYSPRSSLPSPPPDAPARKMPQGEPPYWASRAPGPPPQETPTPPEPPPPSQSLQTASTGWNPSSEHRPPSTQPCAPTSSAPVPQPTSFNARPGHPLPRSTTGRSSLRTPFESPTPRCRRLAGHARRRCAARWSSVLTSSTVTKTVIGNSGKHDVARRHDRARGGRRRRQLHRAEHSGDGLVFREIRVLVRGELVSCRSVTSERRGLERARRRALWTRAGPSTGGHHDERIFTRPCDRPSDCANLSPWWP